MTSEKLDRRVKYTKKVLKESLVEILEKKNIDKITIKEICEKADINRSTFYTHYYDQYDLLHQIENEVIQGINEHLDNYYFKSNRELESYETLKGIFDYIVENSKVCKVLLGENGIIELQKKILMIVQEQIIRKWQKETSLNNETAEYLLLFSVNGSIGIVQKWIQSGMKKPSDEIAKMILTITSKGLSAYI
ncbi:MAG: TetR/AcrR family transcriptional regulator [Bacilli bacterium]|nr:TetR/AcrR family transcriptional regulator [Bacilli bacterium]